MTAGLALLGLQERVDEPVGEEPRPAQVGLEHLVDWSLSTAVTSAPAMISHLAIASPMPRAAPVTTARRPRRSSGNRWSWIACAYTLAGPPPARPSQFLIRIIVASRRSGGMSGHCGICRVGDFRLAT